ncbi:MAG: TIGR02594 family protein [Rhizobiales bacterium]|nr:TIGR02594 family protein [Hyphomicrobiales bacterium]
MQKYLQIAMNEQGTKEVKGQKDNPKIVQYFADVGHSWVKDDETAWCAAFVGSCLEKAGLTSTRALNARSYLKWGRKISKPVVGCVVIFKRGNSSWQGHVAFYMGETDTHIKVLGGNQGNTVKISSYKRKDLLGFRLPKTKLNSKTNIASLVGVGGIAVSQFETIEKTINKVTDITSKGGDIADQVGGIFNSITWPMVAIIGIIAVFGFIIMERNKKVNEHGL